MPLAAETLFMKPTDMNSSVDSDVTAEGST